MGSIFYRVKWLSSNKYLKNVDILTRKQKTLNLMKTKTAVISLYVAQDI